MDVDFWAARVQSSKAHSAVQSAKLNRSGSLIDDEEDDVRTWFPCPFCYVEIEVPVLCSHLQDEHCFDLKNAVCPICAAILGKDAIGHFTMQHAQSVKRRRKSQRSGVWNHAMTSKDFRELTSFLNSNSSSNQSNNQEPPASDPLLLPFLTTIPISETNDDCTVTVNADLSENVDSSRISMSDPDQEEDYAEKMQRSVFFQELIMSTIF